MGWNRVIGRMRERDAAMIKKRKSGILDSERPAGETEVVRAAEMERVRGGGVMS